MRRPLCGNLRLHAHDLCRSKSGAAPTRKKKERSMFLSCHSEHEWETAWRNAPLSSYQQRWGRSARALVAVCVCAAQNQVSEGEQRGVLVAAACRPPVGLSFLLHLLLLAQLTRPLHFLICPGQASFLSAINLRLHPPIFIPFTVCFSFTSCSLGLEQIYAWFDHRSLHWHDDS